MAEVETPDEQNSFVFREGNGTLATPSSEFTPLPDTVADPETPAVIEEIRARIDSRPEFQQKIHWDSVVKKIHTLTRGARKHRDFRHQVATLMDEIGLGRARDLGCNGRYDEAVTELQQYIATNPELRLRIAEAPQRFCADILDDQPKEFQGVELGDNSGSIRTVKQLKDQALKNAMKLRLGKASAINGVANSLEDYDGAYLLLDQGLTDEDKYIELSHELDTWISNGAFLQPLRGDWRQMRKADNQFVDEEGTVRHANLEMDEYFAGTMGWRDPN